MSYTSPTIHSSTSPQESSAPQENHNHEGAPCEEHQQQTAAQQQSPAIIDVAHFYQNGNYLPLLHCLKYNLIPDDFRDDFGYHPLHSAAAAGQLGIVLILLDHFKIDVNIKSRSNQTALMIACNYNYPELIKILCDRGALINEQEDTKFSALMYTVQHNLVPAFSYLLSLNADITVRDTNGCTLMHWAAFKNNVFMIQVLHRLGLDPDIADYAGFTPLDRAIQAGSFESVSYLLKHRNEKLPLKVEFDKIEDSDVQELVREVYFKTPLEQKKEKLRNYVKTNSIKLTTGAYVGACVLAMIIYLHAVMPRSSNYVFDLFFLGCGIYFTGYVYWYCHRPKELIKKQQGYESLLSASQSTETGTEMVSPSLGPKMNYGNLDKLVQYAGGTSKTGDSDGFMSFLHKYAYLFHSEKFKEIGEFYKYNYCPTCLIKRPVRTHHVDEVGSCVDDFHHYSNCLDRCVTTKDHFLYFSLLTKQVLLIVMLLVHTWIVYAEDTSNYLVLPLEVNYILYKDFGILYSGFYTLLLVVLGYSFAFWAVEAYGIIMNIRHFEIFNAPKCSYLYRLKQEKSGNIVKTFYNPYHKGKRNNVKEYFANISKGKTTDQYQTLSN